MILTQKHTHEERKREGKKCIKILKNKIAKEKKNKFVEKREEK